MSTSPSTERQKNPSYKFSHKGNHVLAVVGTKNTAEEYFSNFMEQVSRSLPEENQRFLFQKARRIAARTNDIRIEPFVAALVLNKAHGILSTLYPGDCLKTRQRKARSKPETARVLKLAKSASAYLKEVRLAESLLSKRAS